jgi:hypothetical protein
MGRKGMPMWPIKSKQPYRQLKRLALALALAMLPSIAVHDS